MALPSISYRVLWRILSEGVTGRCPYPAPKGINMPLWGLAFLILRGIKFD
jgi:hypothetical protein